MTTIVVQAGSPVRVRFSTLDSGEVDCDGEFEIHYDTVEHRKQLVIKETAGLPGSVKGGAKELLYVEAFGDSAAEKVAYFLVGSKVKILPNDSEYVGYTGEVSSEPDEKGLIKVKFSNSLFSFFYSDELELVK